MRPCSLVDVYDHLGRTTVKGKMMVAGFCLTLASIYQSTWRRIEKDLKKMFDRFSYLHFLWRYNSDSVLAFSTITFPFKAVLYLFCPVDKLHLLQIIPDIIFPWRLGPSSWSSCEWFLLC